MKQLSQETVGPSTALLTPGPAPGAGTRNHVHTQALADSGELTRSPNYNHQVPSPSFVHAAFAAKAELPPAPGLGCSRPVPWFIILTLQSPARLGVAGQPLMTCLQG